MGPPTVPLYFAYGSNMSAPQMADRCPGAVALGPTRLPGYRFRINTHGSANIVPDAGSGVHGVLWNCAPRDLKTLDLYEGVRVRNYLRRHVVVVSDAGESYPCLTYIGTRTWPGRPRVNYMMTAVIPGAVAHGLPDAYLEELHAWMPRVVIGEKKIRYRGRRR
ncbi:MAG: gamma-glutamylcyclotransferase family protein [Hyphomicrobiaceae bacterium]